MEALKELELFLKNGNIGYQIIKDENFIIISVISTTKIKYAKTDEINDPFLIKVSRREFKFEDNALIDIAIKMCENRSTAMLNTSLNN